jgi:hypothetical protein
LEDLGVNGKIILEWSLGKQGGKIWLYASDSGLGPVASPCDHGNETSGSIKVEVFLD